MIRNNRYAPLLALGLSALATHAAAAPAKLPPFNVDIQQTSVSGLSSGGFMAVQFNMAYSSIMKGAGVVAGGPYYCAQGSLSTATMACMNAFSSTNVPGLVATTNKNAKAGLIDPPANLSKQKLWLFSGKLDSVVKQSVMNDLQSYYRNFSADANIKYVKNMPAEHAMPTTDFGNSCSTRAEPFINDCDFDGAGDLLKWIYGTELNTKNTAPLPPERFFEFDQSEFLPNPNGHSMSNSGWMYIPANCAAGQSCKLHVVFHGCKQYPTYSYFDSGSNKMVQFGLTYVKNAGYNQWADSNNMIVLYPQATNGSGNPNGCWDWWGYDSPNYATKSGNQMQAVKKMVDRIASGAATVPAPSGLKVDSASDSSISLSWSAATGATGYNVYRNGKKVTSDPVAATTFTDGGLCSGSSFRYTVRALGASGAEGPPSPEVTGKTAGQPCPVAAPTKLAVGAVGRNSVDLSWTASADAVGYNIYRFQGAAGPDRVNQELVKDTKYTVGGLDSGKSYDFTVRAENAGGASSADSNKVTASTPETATCFRANNFQHVLAGRAHNRLGFAYANGSDAKMGWNNVFIVTTLKQTKPNFYVIDLLACP